MTRGIDFSTASGIASQEKSTLRTRNLAASSGSNAPPPERSQSGRVPLGREETEGLAARLESALGHIEGKVSVSVDDGTGMIVVRITDSATGEVVRQIPPQEILDADLSVNKIAGLLVDDQA